MFFLRVVISFVLVPTSDLRVPISFELSSAFPLTVLSSFLMLASSLSILEMSPVFLFTLVSRLLISCSLLLKLLIAPVFVSCCFESSLIFSLFLATCDLRSPRLLVSVLILFIESVLEVTSVFRVPISLVDFLRDEISPVFIPYCFERPEILPTLDFSSVVSVLMSPMSAVAVSSFFIASVFEVTSVFKVPISFADFLRVVISPVLIPYCFESSDILPALAFSSEVSVLMSPMSVVSKSSFFKASVFEVTSVFKVPISFADFLRVEISPVFIPYYFDRSEILPEFVFSSVVSVLISPISAVAVSSFVIASVLIPYYFLIDVILLELAV